MATAKKGLGRGFASLIPTEIISEEFDVTSSTDGEVSELRHIKLDKIVRDENQPRRSFNEASLQDLANSIREHGVIAPIIVVATRGGKFKIVAGERRWRAGKIVGLKTIPALVRTLSGQHRLELSLIENAQREDLNPLEFATALAKMRDQFNMNQQQIADKIGKSIQVVSNHLRLFSLPDFAKKPLADGKMSEGHARQILSLEGDEEAQKALVSGILNHHWSVRKAEEFVIAYKRGGKLSTRKAAKAVQRENDFTRSISSIIGLPVQQKVQGHGAGQIIITYKAEKDLDKIKSALDLI